MPLIDWSPFFPTWELKGKYPRIFDDPNIGGPQPASYSTMPRVARRNRRKNCSPPAACTDSGRRQRGRRYQCLRDESRERAPRVSLPAAAEGNRGKPQFSLADFIAPSESGRQDYLGAFAVTAGIGCDELVRRFEKEHDDYNSIMAKALADRLAEAFAEYLHKQAARRLGLRPREISNQTI